jgi:hypothetical protein
LAKELFAERGAWLLHQFVAVAATFQLARLDATGTVRDLAVRDPCQQDSKG